MGQNELKFEFLGVTGWIVRSFNQKLKGLLTSDVNPIPLRRGLLAPAPHLPSHRPPPTSPQPRAPQSADAELARPLVEPGLSSPGREDCAASRSSPSPPSPRPVGSKNTFPRFRHLVPSAHPGRRERGRGGLKLPANGPLFLLHAWPPAHPLLVAQSWSPLELGSRQCRRKVDTRKGAGGEGRRSSRSVTIQTSPPPPFQN